MCLNLVRVCVHILLKICDCISVSVCIKGGTKNIGFIFHTPFNERFLSSDFLRRRVMNLQKCKILSLQVCSLSVVFKKIQMDDLFVHPNFYGPGATDLQLKNSTLHFCILLTFTNYKIRKCLENIFMKNWILLHPKSFCHYGMNKLTIPSK